MSEDRDADAPAAEPAAELVTGPDAGAEAPVVDADPPLATRAPAVRRNRRIATLSIAALLVTIGAFAIARLQRGGGQRPGTGSGAASGVAIRAPVGPTAPGDPVRGVRIGGTVVDGAGMPVASAEVSAELERGAPDRALAGASAAASGSATATAGGDSASAAVVHLGTATAADGRFAVDVPAPGRYRLRVTGPGLLPAEVRYVPVPSDEVRIVIARQVRIDGMVVDGTTPVPNAFVGLRGDAIGGTLETRSDSTGAFYFADLPEGRYQLFAWQNALAARAVRVNRLGSGPFAATELRLEEATIVVGRVVDRDGGAGVVAAVELRPIGDDQAPRYARSGDDGVFRIEGVPHGEWVADAFAPGYTSPGGIQIEAGRGIPELALIRGGTVEGRILDGDSNPIAGATVRALGTSGANASSAPEYSQAVDQDRLRRFSGLMAAPTPVTGVLTADPQLIPRGELGVTVGPIPPIPPPGTSLARTASIDPAVGSFVGEPLPLAIEPSRAPVWTTGPDGRYRIRGLPKGKVVVLATAPSFAEGRSKAVAIELGATLANVDIMLSPGTMIVGKVTDQHGVPVAGAQLTAKPDVGAALEGFTDGDGSYRLGPLDGTVQLAATAFGHGDVRRTLELAIALGATPAERREDLVLVVADAMLAGTLDDATGATVGDATIEVIGGAGEGRRAVTRDDGTFAIDMLPDGPLRVRITHVAYPPVELATAASTAGKVRVRLRLPLGGAVEGALIDGGSGAPLAGIAIAATAPASASVETVTDKVGHWTLGPLVPGRWKIAVKEPGYLPLVREVDVPVSRAPGVTSVRDIRLDLARGALVGGIVRDARGRRVAGARITVQLADGSGPFAEATTDSEGEFRVRDCPTGEVVITATRDADRGTTHATIRPGDEVLGLAIELR